MDVLCMSGRINKLGVRVDIIRVDGVRDVCMNVCRAPRGRMRERETENETRERWGERRGRMTVTFTCITPLGPICG